MPDTLQQLYKNNKQIKAENRYILGAVSEGNFVSPDYTSIERAAPDLSGRTPSNFEDISRYERFVPDPEMVLSYGNLDKMRAQGQSGLDQLGNMTARVIPDVILGTVQNLANIVDVEDYFNIDNEVGNAVSNTMQDWMDSVNKSFPIYRENQGKAFDVGDSGWWMDNASNLINSAGSFALTGYITGGILSRMSGLLGAGRISTNAANTISKAVSTEEAQAAAAGNLWDDATRLAKTAEYQSRYLDKINNIANKGTSLLNAIALNQAESIQEASGVYKDVYTQKFAEGDSEEVAKQKAADAAALDVNLNRVNILSNLTSAGLFTKANKAIVDAAGGLKGEIISETIQEGLEEGVNYIAQMEAMEQAKQGNEYRFDLDRALSHLKEPQGLESMFLGALGGGLQTGLTELLMSTKDKARDAYDSVKNTFNKINPNTSNKADISWSKINDVNEYFKAKSNAKTQQEHDEIDNNFINNFGKKSYVDGSIDVNIGEFNRLANLNVEDEVKSSGLKPNEVQDIKDRASMALSVLTSIKESGDELDVKSLMNPSEVLDKKMELNKLSSDRKSAEDALNNFQQNVKTKNPQITDSDLNKQSKIFLDRYNAALTSENVASQELDALINPIFQEELKKKNVEKQQKVLDLKNDKKASSVKSSVSNVSIKPKDQTITETASSTTGDKTINTSNSDAKNIDDLVEKVEFQDGKSISDRFGLSNTTNNIPVSDDDITEFGGDPDTISIVSDKNGDQFIVMPSRNNGKLAPSISYSLRRSSDNKPSTIASIRAAVDEMNNNPSMSMKFSGIKFTLGELNSFMESRGKKAEGKSYSKEDFFDFIASKKNIAPQVEPATKSKIDPLNSIVEDFHEPEKDLDLNKISKSIEIASTNTKKSNPSSINYLAEKYKIVDGKYIGTGEVNNEYLVNSDPSKVFPGAEIIIEVYDGAPILTYNYDENGNVIVKNGVKSATLRNATIAAKEGRELPIAIYIKNNDGSKGELIGFLPETQWLNEGGVGNRKNISESNVDYVNSIVSDINGLRQDITNAFAIGVSIQVSSKISDVSAGYTVKSDSVGSISSSIPDIISDTKSLGIKSPFGYISNGVVYIGDIPVENISNQSILSNGIIPNGTPILLLPSQNNMLHAVPVKSKRIKDVDGGIKHVKNGILAHLGILKSAQDKFNDYAMKNNLKLIDSADGLRDYIKTFVHMESSDIFGNSNVSDRHAIVIWEQADTGDVFVKYGVTSGNGTVVNLTKLGRQLKSSNSDEKSKANSELEKILSNIGEMRHNFQSNMVNKKNEFIGIEDTWIKKLNPNYLSRYMDTLETNVKVAGKSNGKNIYTIQHVIGIDFGSKIESGDITTRPEIVKEEIPKDKGIVIPTELEAKPQIKKQFKKRIVGDEGIDLIESNVKSSISIEPIVDNKLSDINPSDSEKMGDEIIKHCK